MIDVDVVGRLLIENFIELKFDFTAAKPKLGWTEIGKQNSCREDNILTALSMHVRKVPISELSYRNLKFRNIRSSLNKWR